VRAAREPTYPSGKVTQPHRLPAGGLIERDRTLSFTFDGRG
jgi:hypothetical protein